MIDDDHGTLRDENGAPLAYRVCEWPLPNIPLTDSRIWPDDLRNADWYAAGVEARTSTRLGFVQCSADHRHCAPHCEDCDHARPCYACGAAL